MQPARLRAAKTAARRGRFSSAENGRAPDRSPAAQTPLASIVAMNRSRLVLVAGHRMTSMATISAGAGVDHRAGRAGIHLPRVLERAGCVVVLESLRSDNCLM